MQQQIGISNSMEEDEAGVCLDLCNLKDIVDEDQDKLTASDADVYAQLAQKEKDLILAAELGKALLAKNQEMVVKYEQQTEESNLKIEELTQTRHELSLKLDIVSAEYEATVRELQADVVNLRSRLNSQSEQVRQGQHSRTAIVSQLTAQNERLNEQLLKATEREGDLQRQVDVLREQISNRKLTALDQTHQLDLLRQELSICNLRSGDLERRVTGLVEERDTLTSSLEEAQDRIICLERHTDEHQLQVTELKNELKEVQAHNYSLQEHVEMLSTQTSSDHGNSLLHELEMSHSDDSSVEPDMNCSATTKIGHGQKECTVSINGSVCEDEQITQLHAQLACRDLQLQRQHTELQNLANQVQAQVEDMSSLRTERDQVLDGLLGVESDQVLLQAREERDQAFTKLGQVEVELANARVDISTLDGQLMEAIQQKVSLSQQLDQWEVDMHELLGAQMARQIRQEEKSVSAPHSPATQRRRRFPPWNS